jgi:hypothetical protein
LKPDPWPVPRGPGRRDSPHPSSVHQSSPKVDHVYNS